MESRQLLAASINEYQTQIIGGRPNSITTGPDGNLWYTLPGVSAIGSINPKTHAFQTFIIPSGSQPQSITAGPDGELWFTSQFGSNGLESEIGSFNPTTHAFVETPIPVNPYGSTPGAITPGPDGNLYFAEAPANIGKINPTTRVITDSGFSLPNARPLGLTTGPDGNIWFTSSVGNIVGTFNPTTHTSAEYNIPSHLISSTSGIEGSLSVTPSDLPNGITTGPDGNLWFTETLANRIGMINPSTHAVADFFLPKTSSFPDSITAGPDGNLWFTESGRLNFNVYRSFGNQDLTPYGVSAIGSIDPTTDAIATYATPTINSNPLGITTGPDGHLWFVEGQADQIGEAITHSADGPQIDSVARLGYHNDPTSLVLTFNGPLDPASAKNVGNYRIVGPRGWTIPVASASYNAINHTVTLGPSTRLGVFSAYQLTVVGVGPTGVTDNYGQLLDGARTGQPGTDFVSTLTRKNLILGQSVPTVATFAHPATHLRPPARPAHRRR